MAPSLLRARLLPATLLRPARPAPSVPSALRTPFARSTTPARRAATTSARATDAQPLGRLRVVLLSTSIAATLYVSYLYLTDTRSGFHRYVVPPALRLVFPDAEDAHHYGTLAMRAMYALGVHIRERPARTLGAAAEQPSDLAVEVFGTTLANPVGISAGLDKDAEIPDALFALGAAVVEVGGCTPRPQPGNPRPRVWRVPAVEGMVNRYGLNSRGADAVARTLRERVRVFGRRLGLTEQQVLDGEGVDVPPGSLLPGRLLAVQVAKNKDTDERDLEAVARDYVYCVERLARYADVLVVNVSSPNTPGLRDLQAVEPLTRILGAVVAEARRAPRRVKPRVMVKVSPDEDEPAQVEGIAQAVWASGVDGVIVGNTTKRRGGELVPQGGVPLTGREQRALAEQGGFSGPTMFGQTLDLVARYRRALDGHPLRGRDDAQKVIFASGGIKDGRQALQVLDAGASVAMLYTGLVYGGSGTVTRMKDEMRREIADGRA